MTIIRTAASHLEDVLAAAATLGAFGLWVVALHLLA
jgi:hypothetical protein